MKTSTRRLIAAILAAAPLVIAMGCAKHLKQPADVPPGRTAPPPDTKATDTREPYVVDETVPSPPPTPTPVPPKSTPKPPPPPPAERTY